METMRAFIAIPLPGSLLERLTALQRKLERRVPDRSVRWVRAESIHLTLKFLGDTSTEKLPDIGQALEIVARHAPACSFTVGELGCFPAGASAPTGRRPNPRRPRVVWVGVQEPTGRLAALQDAIEEVLAPLGYPPEGRGFTPHLTLGRAHRRASRSDMAQVGEIVAGTTVGTLAEVPADRFELIRSVLKSSGAEYTTLAEFKLRGGDS